MPNIRLSTYCAMDSHVDYSDIEFYSTAVDHTKERRHHQLDVNFGETSVHLPSTTTSMEEAICIDEIMSLVADQRVKRQDNYKENAQPTYRAGDQSSQTSFAPVRQPVIIHSKLHEALTQPTPPPNRLPQNPVKCGKCGEELSSRCLVQACSKKMLEETSCRRCGNELTTKCILSMCTPVSGQPPLITHN